MFLQQSWTCHTSPLKGEIFHWTMIVVWRVIINVSKELTVSQCTSRELSSSHWVPSCRFDVNCHCKVFAVEVVEIVVVVVVEIVVVVVVVIVVVVVGVGVGVRVSTTTSRGCCYCCCCCCSCSCSCFVFLNLFLSSPFRLSLFMPEVL